METAAPTMKIMKPRRTTGLFVMKVRILAMEVVNQVSTSEAVDKILAMEEVDSAARIGKRFTIDDYLPKR